MEVICHGKIEVLDTYLVKVKFLVILLPLRARHNKYESIFQLTHHDSAFGALRWKEKCSLESKGWITPATGVWGDQAEISTVMMS